MNEKIAPIKDGVAIASHNDATADYENLPVQSRHTENENVIARKVN